MVVLNKLPALYQTSFCQVPLCQDVLVLSAMWAASPAGGVACLHQQGYFISAELGECESEVVVGDLKHSPTKFIHLAESKHPSHKHCQSLLGTTCPFAGNRYFTP